MGLWASCLTEGTLCLALPCEGRAASALLQMSPRLGQSSVLETVMSIPFLRGHAAPLCAPKGTCACSASLHEGGGGSLGLFTALRSRPSARMTLWGGGDVFAVLSLPVCPPPGVLWLLLWPPSLRAHGRGYVCGGWGWVCACVCVHECMHVWARAHACMCWCACVSG